MRLFLAKNEAKMKIYWVTILIAGLVGCSTSPNHKHWAYDDAEGPKHWAELSESYSVCGNGKNQSPVNIQDTIESEFDTLTFNYRSNMSNILHNGHTVMINIVPGSLFSDGIETFELKQFHFHTPSEHLIAGKSFPLEAHFVHTDDQGNLAVIAVLFEVGDENPAIKKLWSTLPKHSGDQHSLPGTAHDYLKLLPQKMDFYRYNGSLTTPPCSEGVRWFVFKQPVSVSKGQIDTFYKAIGHSNNRPVQTLYGREILK